MHIWNQVYNIHRKYLGSHLGNQCHTKIFISGGSDDEDKENEDPLDDVDQNAVMEEASDEEIEVPTEVQFAIIKFATKNN